MEETPEMDRISALPNAIRYHILSLLPRRSAIRTGVLSKQWKDSWKYRFSGSITVDFSEKVSRGLEPDYVAAQIGSVLLQHYNSRVDSFHLSLFPGDHHLDTVIHWIKHVVSRGVEDIDLDFYPGRFFWHEDYILIARIKVALAEHNFQPRDGGNPVVVVLKLRWCRLNPEFSFQSFSSLQVLHLFQVDLMDFMVDRLINNCPLLENLELRECDWVRNIRVSHPNSRIKRLAIIDCFNVEQIYIFAPNLQVFHSHGKFPRGYMLERTPLLNDFIITSCQDEYLTKVETVIVEHSLEVLSLCSRALQYIFGAPNSYFPAFEYLRELQLVMMRMTDDSMFDIFHFFREFNFPSLEKIFVEFPTVFKETPMFNFMNLPTAVAPAPNFNNLKIVKLINFKCYQNEVNLAWFFITNAVSLDHIILVLDRGTEYNFENLQQQALLMMNEAEEVTVQLDDDGSVRPKHKKIYCEL